MKIPTIKFENGEEMPMIGFGTYMLVDGNRMYHSILCALKSGYKMLDTAKWYNNEHIVGDAIRDSGVDRKDLFITSKQMTNTYEITINNVLDTLNKFHTDYLDLVLVHWPTTPELNKETYRALEDLVEKGIIKSIGISNYHQELCEELLKECRIKPQVNQIETHVYFQEDKMNEYLTKNNIVHESWAPFCEGYLGLLQDKTLEEIGKKYNKSIAQVALRYLVQKNIVVIPKSNEPDHIEENLKIFDFELNEEDMKTIKKLDRKALYSGWPSNMQQETKY